ncbi:mCG145087, partial [Mus musculus]
RNGGQRPPLTHLKTGRVKKAHTEFYKASQEKKKLEPIGLYFVLPEAASTGSKRETSIHAEQARPTSFKGQGRGFQWP